MPTHEEIVQTSIAKQMAIKENFIAHYLAETGADTANTRLVEQRDRDGFTTHYWCEPITSKQRTAEEELNRLSKIAKLAAEIVEKQAEILHLLSPPRGKM